jgi:hypothetical protein
MAYARKYATKADQKDLPNEYKSGFGRWWGVRGYRETLVAAMGVQLSSANAREIFDMLTAIENIGRSAEKVGDVKKIPWKYKNGIIYGRAKGDINAFRAESKWRERMEIELSKGILRIDGIKVARNIETGEGGRW